MELPLTSLLVVVMLLKLTADPFLGLTYTQGGKGSEHVTCTSPIPSRQNSLATLYSSSLTKML